MRQFLLAIAIVFALTSLTPAHAEFEPRVCRGLFPNGQTEAQFWTAEAALDKCQRDFMGIVPIEQRAAAGESVVRAYVQRDERSLPLFIEYVRERNGRGWLNIRTIDERKPVLAAAISDAAFSAVQTRWVSQALIAADAKMKYDAEKTELLKRGVETVSWGCWSAAVETVDAGSVKKVDLDGCKSWEFQFIDFLFGQAVKDAGDCATREPEGSDDLRLQFCLLRGKSPRTFLR